MRRRTAARAAKASACAEAGSFGSISPSTAEPALTRLGMSPVDALERLASRNLPMPATPLATAAPILVTSPVKTDLTMASPAASTS